MENKVLFQIQLGGFEQNITRSCSTFPVRGKKALLSTCEIIELRKKVLVVSDAFEKG